MLGRRIGLILANTLAGAVLGFVALKVFAVATGPDAEDLLGQLAFAMGLAGLFSVVLDMGLNAAHTRHVSEGHDVGRAIATYAAAKVGLAVLFVVGISAAAFTGAALGLLQDTPRLAVVLISLSFAFLGLRNVFTATFDGRHEFAKSQLSVLVENLVRAPLMALFALAFAAVVLNSGPLVGLADGLGSGTRGLVEHHAAEALAACYALAGLSSLVVAAALYRKEPWGKVDPVLLRRYWGFARHIFVASAVLTVYVSLDKVVITAFWGPANTGRYFGAQRISDMIQMVPAAAYTVLFPALSAIAARGARDEVRRGMENALRHISLLVVPLAAVAIALASPLLALILTGEFNLAVPTLRVLAVFAVLASLMYPYATLLNALGKPDRTARAAIVATVLNLALNLVLVPPRGTLGLPLPGLAETGSALATVVAMGVQLLLLRAEVHRWEGPVPLGHTAKHVIAGALVVAMLVPLAPDPAHAAWFMVLALAALGGLVYLGVLALLKEFTRADLATYLSIVNPAAMARYAHAEVRQRGAVRTPAATGDGTPPGAGSGSPDEGPSPPPEASGSPGSREPGNRR